jgi:hypothetical protein
MVVSVTLAGRNFLCASEILTNRGKMISISQLVNPSYVVVSETPVCCSSANASEMLCTGKHFRCRIDCSSSPIPAKSLTI